MDKPMMKCGHAANSTHDGEPACAICFPHPKATEVDESPPSLEGRTARCFHYGQVPTGRNMECRQCRRGEPCRCERPSSPKLAFFEHKPDLAYDRYYCGCWGWG